nr:immunoglobulin heavy chain junction region [Mus musculus]
CARNWDYW